MRVARCNMVGGAVAMVISTMHEQSYIDLHNAKKLKKVPKFGRNHNEEIAEASVFIKSDDQQI